MLRKATPQDVPQLEAFLASHAASSMFLRGNLESHGTQERDHPHGTTFLIKEEAGEITAVAGCTNGGFLMCQAPGQNAAFWQAVCVQLEGRRIYGITGMPDQTDLWTKALGLEAADFSLNQVTPLFQLDLVDLAVVDAGLSLRRPVSGDISMLTLWYAGFHHDTGLKLGDGVTDEDIATRFVDDPNGRILMRANAPVAMTKLNARAVDAVQVGGVYVPPEHRGNGYGGDVVALHLAELAGQGVRQAVLFAANEYAARAYARIGFRQVGGYRVAMFASPVVVGAARAGSNLEEG